MNYAVFNPSTRELKTVVTEPKGSIPEGFQFVPENQIPPDAVRLASTSSVPDEVKTWKLREALAVAGLLTQVDTLISGLPAQQKAVASNRWEYKDTIQRSHPLTLAIGAGLKLTAKQMDDLFIQAAGIQ